MRTQPITIKTALGLGVGAVFSLFLAACDRPPRSGATELVEDFFEVPKQTVSRVHRNQLGNEPTEFLRRRATDSFHWQVWSPQLFADAEAEQRLVFAIIGSGQHPETNRLLDKLRNEPAIIDALHRNYVCALADLEVNPELGPLITNLAVEIRRPVSFPAMIWMSHEGNPVAWLPLRANDIEDFAAVFDNSNAMVSGIWRESPGYVVRNSRRDNENRRERSLPNPDPPDEDAGEGEPVQELPSLASVYQRSLRRLTSLYDPASRSIDGSGGLVPSGILNLAALTALHPGTSDTMVGRASGLLGGTCDVLQRGAIRDPLDGGFFSARRSSGWDLPVFIKATDTQSQIGMAYARAATALDFPAYLDVSRETLAYAGRVFGQGGDGLGLFELTPSRTLEPRVFLWPQEKLRELLTDAEFRVAKAAFMTTGIGNIPPESDPERDYFRKNSLGMKRTPAEAAATLGISEDEVRETLDAVCRRLLSQRQELLTRVDGSLLEETRITGTNARFVSALAVLSRVSGDPEPLAQAQALLAYLKSRHYSEQGGLLRIAASDSHRKVAARGIDYAALLNAIFDVYAVDLDPAHLAWARVLGDDLLERHLTADGNLLEVPVAEQLGLLEVYNITMIFGDSTWGTVYGPLERLHQLTDAEPFRKTADQLRDHVIGFLVAGQDRTEMVHTDFLCNALIPLADTVVYLSGDPGAPEFAALHGVLREPAFHAATILHLQDPLPAGIVAPISPAPGTMAHVFSGGAPLGEAATPADLERLLRKALTGR